MNRTSRTNKVIFFLILSVVLVIVYLLCELSKPSTDWHIAALIYALGALLGAGMHASFSDLKLEESCLVATSLFKVQKIDLTNLEICDVKFYKGPNFSLITNVCNINATYTKANYKVIQELVRLNNEKHITLDKLERLVKYSGVSLK